MFFVLLFLQWPHPSDGDRDQPGRRSGAQDPSQVRWPGVRQCKNHHVVLTTDAHVVHLTDMHMLDNVSQPLPDLPDSTKTAIQAS